MSLKGKRKQIIKHEKDLSIMIRMSLYNVHLIESQVGERYKIPLYQSKVQAGFPSPADDYIEDSLDLNQFLIKHPSATYLLRAIGDAMGASGINEGNILIVDRSINPRHGKIVISVIEGDLTVRRLYKKKGQLKLEADNPSYPDIIISDKEDLVIWGVVTNCIVTF